MSYPKDLGRTTVTDAATMIREGRTTAAELMEAVLQRAATTEPALHAYSHLDHDAARSAARKADLEMAKHGPKGPLHGIPIGVKDLIETTDMPTEAGSAVLKGNRPLQDAPVVQKLREAGAIIVGKQQTHEFGFGNDEPPTRNPWDPHRYAGGSTIGGGVSVAVGSSLAAIGTDGGGSIRKPAAINGLVGLKPTFGKVSTAGIIPGATSVDHIGWLTKSVADAKLFLTLLADTPDSYDSSGVSGLRLGCASYFFQDLDPDIEKHVRHCLDALSLGGAEIVWFDLPELESAVDIHGTIASYESVAKHAALIEKSSELYHPANLRLLNTAAAMEPHRFRAAQDARIKLGAAIQDAMNAYNLDALCSPTLRLPPVLLPEMNPEVMLPQYCRFTAPFNLTGQPAVSVPCGTDGRGLPVGFQVAGRLGNDAMTLRIAEAVEAAGLWTQPRSMGAMSRTGFSNTEGGQDTFVSTRL